MPRIALFSGSMNINIVIAYIFALFLLYLIARLLLSANRTGGKLLGRAGLTVMAIILLNAVGTLVGYRVPLNLMTILLPTFLGVPGFALVVLLQYLIF
ncbi:MAG: hypothetical protein GX033_10675 [Firmicutes bacterium]|nr:hypothetical protein [Bacillota bacterium]